MTQLSITERQQPWLDHVMAAAAYDGTIVEYAKANSLKTKDIYHLSATEGGGRFTDCRSMTTCWRSAKFSTIN